MKILFPIGTFYPATVGGPNLSVYWLTKELKKHGIEPIVVTTDFGIKREHNIEFNKWINTEYGRVIYVKEKKHALPLKSVSFIKKLVNKEKIDIVHLTSIFYPLSLGSYLVSKSFVNSIVWSPRGELLKGAVDKGKKSLKKVYIYTIKKFLNENVVFHSTSKSETESIRKYFPKSKVVEIKNFISLNNRLNTEVKKQILYLGRLHPKKNIESLIKALKLSKEFKKNKFKLIIAGTGDNSYKEFLVKEVKKLNLENFVSFVGHIEGLRKDKLIAESKCLILPSHSENFGMVVVEALSQGTPVIASKYTPWEELEKYDAGYWIEPKPEFLANALDDIILKEEGEYIKMRKNAYKLAENYDISKNISKWIDFYYSIVGKRHG